MSKQPSMDEMIADCERTQKANEEIVFAIGAGRICRSLAKKKVMEETLEYIKTLDGFVGVHPIDLWHTMLIFKTLNDAKRARNDLKSKGVPLGQIVPILVEKKYL